MNEDASTIAFRATVLEKLERIELRLASNERDGSAFEQVTRERLDGIKWTAAIVSGFVSFIFGAIATVIAMIKKT